MHNRLVASPGAILMDDLHEIKMSNDDLARHLHVNVQVISDVLYSGAPITGDLALRLGRYFGTTPQYWLNLQQNYDIAIAEIRAGDLIRSTVIPQDRSR
jgi:addiction module HigA family antidote